MSTAVDKLALLLAEALEGDTLDLRVGTVVAVHGTGPYTLDVTIGTGTFNGLTALRPAVAYAGSDKVFVLQRKKDLFVLGKL